MQQFLPAELMEPQWLLLLFATMWVGITSLLAMMSGWSSLAGHVRADGRVDGQRFRFVSGSMGMRWFPVSYGGCLFVTVNDAGFGLAIFFLFRLMSPPLFVPWREVESVELRRFLFWRFVVVRVRNHWTAISIRGAAGDAILSAHRRACPSADAS
ncbi:hypothetical protein [uncultured Methylibium sp.]|uniref:hypothetical protein n=1 Tax=uncultured Methylibium sp. TaxID=381093 RepID=UPI0025DAB0E7|nr:hypothetical protein [uncultured Methylibium sp.]